MSVDFGTRLIVAKRRLGYAKLTHRGGMSEERTNDGLISLKAFKEHRRR
jgi:hypothetical protein